MVKEFKNGNLNVNLDNLNNTDTNNIIFEISELLFWHDTRFIGDIVSLGNYDAAYTLYNDRLNKMYYLSGNDIETLKKGKMIKLYAIKPDIDYLKEWEVV